MFVFFILSLDRCWIILRYCFSHMYLFILKLTLGEQKPSNTSYVQQNININIILRDFTVVLKFLGVLGKNLKKTHGQVIVKRKG